MNKNVKVRLAGAAGAHTERITPQAFPTRHIKTGAVKETPPLSITPNLPSPEPVLPAFNAAWQSNRQRLFDFLTEGFSNIAESVILDEIAEAINVKYAKRKEMTPEQWRCLIADLQLPRWTWGHWIFDVKHNMWHKYENLYAGTPMTIETVMTVIVAIHDTYGFKWILFDEIQKVARISFKFKASDDIRENLRDVLRELYRQGRIEHKENPHTPRSKQSMFRLLKTDLQKLLAKVDAVLANGGQSA